MYDGIAVSGQNFINIFDREAIRDVLELIVSYGVDLNIFAMLNAF